MNLQKTLYTTVRVSGFSANRVEEPMTQSLSVHQHILRTMNDWHTNLGKNGIGNEITSYEMSSCKCQSSDLLGYLLREKSLHVAVFGRQHLVPHDSLSSTVIGPCINRSIKSAMLAVQSIMSVTRNLSMETAKREREEVEGFGYCGS